MSRGEGKVRLLACGIFKREFYSLPEDVRSGFEPFFLDSLLHMDPPKLDRVLSGILQSTSRKDTVLAFGDCCPHMEEFITKFGARRTSGLNCCQVYLGRERYRELEAQGAFFLMPEWVVRWREIVMGELGLRDKELARDFMSQSMRFAVYVDTGCVAIPSVALEEFSEFTGLRLQTESPGVANFANALREAVGER